ncbi:MAG: VCBS repeat-containing protein [Planctomycetes bacterium]|nr:VCBS repeat-containing protein [Planctomycetota bacterium]
MRPTAMAAVLLAALGYLPLPAQPTTPPARGALAERFKRFDGEGDGRRSAEEHPRPAPRQMDGDRDGFVTQEQAAELFGSRSEREDPPADPAGPEPASLTQTVNARPPVVYELRVRDLEAAQRFYRDGIGMQVVEEDENTPGTLLSLFGTGLQLLPARAAAPRPDQAGNPWVELIAVNGLRYPSLWFRDPTAICERLEKVGYPRPQVARNVWFTRDPDGNPVELMRVPRGAPGEAFTVGLVAADATATRKFLAEVLGLPEAGVWRLPAPVGEMYLYPVGNSRLKVAAPPGKRRSSSAGRPDAPGWRSMTLFVKNTAAARKTLEERGARVEADGERLVVRDPDGNRIVLAPAPPGMVGLDLPGPRPDRPIPAKEPASPWSEQLAEPRRPGEPPLKKMPDGAPARDAAGRGQLFESIIVPGFTGIQEGTNGLALVDLDRDGLLDIVACYSAPRGSGGNWGPGEKLRVFINEGHFKFREHGIKLLDSRVSPEAFGRGQVPVLADFNRDGFLDLFVTRHAQMSGGQSSPRDRKIGNGLYLSEGAWDVFRDVSAKMGIQNEKAYNRQPSFGDVNRDGWLDIAIGCDNIGNAQGGFPHSRLYVFQPGGNRFEDGTFQDIGGTDLVPDFGGFHHDSTKDRAGPDIDLRDLDNDGDLDLFQSCHVDIRDPSLPYSPVEYRQGVFCWKNLLAEKGELRFEKVAGNGLACEAHLKLNEKKSAFEPVGKAPGLPYISLADVDNDGLLDVLAVGPASPGWAPRTEYVGGRFWRNLGGFTFAERTEAAGLKSLTWTYRQWSEFFDAPSPARRQEGRPYFADAIFGDFDNDGWIDVVVLDRSERPGARAMLFMNRGDGTFELKPTTFSGLDGSGICGEAADLDGDGLLDLVLAADPDNSGLAAGPYRYEDKVYWNTGLHGARANHWLRVRFSGARQADLIGARVTLHEPGTRRLLGMRAIAANQSYKSGSALEAHFGLAGCDLVDVSVAMPDGRTLQFPGVKADRFLELDLRDGEVAEVAARA